MHFTCDSSFREEKTFLGHMIHHFVKTQKHPHWHIANRHVIQCIKRRMAIRRFMKTKHTLASDSQDILISVIKKLLRFNI